MPVTLRPFLSPEYLGRVLSSLAGGQSLVEETYFVDFPFDDQLVRVVATFTHSDEILIGTHLIRDHRLVIDFVGKSVLIERVANSD